MTKNRHIGPPRPLRLPVLLIVFSIIVGTNLQSRPGYADNPKDIFIVVSKNSPVDKISVDEVVALFLKRRTSFSNGDNAIPINPTDSELRESFRSLVLNKSEAEENKYWLNFAIRSGQSPPPTLPQPLKAVFKLPKGISYVFREDMIDAVAKVVLVIPAK